ncbi:hypothetical protein COB55_05095 [Candidatus Wolfebacteria bacterium]|nr:MAG: hypothetical protein COB55_05095 [Candidatus Wolfebacteria bacterium]
MGILKSCKQISLNIDGTVSLSDNSEQCCTSLGHTFIDGVCYWNPPVFGCTDPNAENYDPNATKDDGSCVFGGPLIIINPVTGFTLPPPITGVTNPGVTFDFCDTEEEIQESVTITKEIKFRKNLESNDSEYYNSLDITVRLDRMINYMLAESSVDKKGIVQDISFDTNLKTPYADFYNDIVVVTSAKTTSGTEVTTEKVPVIFKIGDGSKKNLDRFKSFFNVNQVVISSDPLISPPPSDYLEIEKVSKLDTNISPLVLSLSSFDNRSMSGFNENRLFSNDLVPGSGRGGLVISPRVSGYLINITDDLRSKGISYTKINNVDKLSTDERLFFRVTDIEGSTFEYVDQDGIVPSVLIDNGDMRVFTSNEIVLDNSDISTGLIGMSQTNPDQSFQNQYLKLYDRELIKEEVQMMGNFISNNEGTKSFLNKDFPLFKIEKSSFLRGVDTPLVYSTIDPIYLEVKTDDPSIRVGTLKINLKMDLENEITDEDLLGPQPLDNLKDLKLTGGTYVSSSFVVYN